MLMINLNMKKINIFHTYYAHKHVVLTTNVLGQCGN